MFSLAIALLMVASTVEAEAASAEAERAPAADAAQTAATSQDVEKADAKPKKICRKIQGTGSRLSNGKLCKTAEEWKRFFAE